MGGAFHRAGKGFAVFGMQVWAAPPEGLLIKESCGKANLLSNSTSWWVCVHGTCACMCVVWGRVRSVHVTLEGYVCGTWCVHSVWCVCMVCGVCVEVCICVKYMYVAYGV